MHLPENYVKGRPLLLIDFYADWCEPCKWADPVIDQVMNHFNERISLDKINIDEHPQLAKTFHILSVPTFILFHNGAEIWRMRGFDLAPKMISMLEDAMLLIH